MSTPLERLKYHVTGAIERGEKVAVESVSEQGFSYTLGEFKTPSLSKFLRSLKPGSEGQWSIDGRTVGVIGRNANGALYKRYL